MIEIGKAIARDPILFSSLSAVVIVLKFGHARLPA
jgi:hypothetical protein